MQTVRDALTKALTNVLSLAFPVLTFSHCPSREHTLHGAGNGDKQRAHTADLHQRILRALAQDASKQRPAHTACQNRGGVDDRSKPNHVLSLFFPDLPKFYCILLKMSTRRRDIDFPSGKQYTIF